MHCVYENKFCAYIHLIIRAKENKRISFDKIHTSTLISVSHSWEYHCKLTFPIVNHCYCLSFVALNRILCCLSFLN